MIPAAVAKQEHLGYKRRGLVKSKAMAHSFFGRLKKQDFKPNSQRPQAIIFSYDSPYCLAYHEWHLPALEITVKPSHNHTLPILISCPGHKLCQVCEKLQVPDDDHVPLQNKQGLGRTGLHAIAPFAATCRPIAYSQGSAKFTFMAPKACARVRVYKLTCTHIQARHMCVWCVHSQKCTYTHTLHVHNNTCKSPQNRRTALCTWPGAR